ncbi:MAG: 2-amino-4-hydroxy-6-hydroxymethyldihydropteridine diphosphokinase [Lachnospiraceae bacterium]
MDQIIIKGLETFGYHGVFEEENFLGQKFIVDAVLYFNTRKAGKQDDLELSVDYGEACKLIKKTVEVERFLLIEALAEEIASKLLLTFSLLESVEVTVKKPWAPILLSMDTVAVSIKRGWHKVYLSIGSNMGDKEGYLDFAIDQINGLADAKVVKASDYIVTKPYGDVEQDDFLNGALEVQTLQSPEEFLETIHKIEKDAHRERLVHWGPRTLDIDILFYDDERIMEDDLMIPHGEIPKREFVLQPLSQIAPYYIHPVLHKSVLEMLSDLQNN